MGLAVRRGYGSEWVDIRELVQPRSLMVRQVLAQLHAQHRAVGVRDMWAWVVDHIQYPLGAPAWEDLHIEMRYVYGAPPLMRFVQIASDYWPWPSETLRDRVADCKGSSVLLCSMLRSILPPKQVYCTLGTVRRGRGREHAHAWVAMPRGREWIVLDTTLAPGTVPRHGYAVEAPAYMPEVRFNDCIAVRVTPGAGSAWVKATRYHDIGGERRATAARR